MQELKGPSDAYLALNLLPGVGPASMNRLLQAFGQDPRRILRASRNELEGVGRLSGKAIEALQDWESIVDLRREEESLLRRGVDFLSRDHADYPSILKETADPPIGLYRLGKYNFEKPMVAVVGTRNCTLYGRSVAQSLGRQLSDLGFCVVSGMARGIDTFAHKGALESEGGSTVCVLGCGIDIVYPPENFEIYKEAQANGAVLSEFPFGRRADRNSFPMRNRLVSGLSHAVVVVESESAGGSMITARFAGEQGRIVCAVPGRIDQKSSSGCNELIRDGAVLLGSVEDLLQELSHLDDVPHLDLGTENAQGAGAPEIDLTAEEARLYRLLDGGEAMSLEDLATRSGRSIAEASVTVMTLELRGVLSKRLDGRFEQSLRS